MLPQDDVVKMYYFAIDWQVEILYLLLPPQGWEAFMVFDNSAVSIQHSAKSSTKSAGK
jgi:hypothetical protein